MDVFHVALYPSYIIYCLGGFVAPFPFQAKDDSIENRGEAKKDWRSIVVYVTFAITVILWMFDKYTGVNANTVAMIPVAIFCVTGVITKRDLEEINWSVLWMVAGGFALGVALNETGLANHLIVSIPLPNGRLSW